MISVRGSSPNIASGSWTDPASLPSRVVIFISMSRALLRGGSGRLGRGNLGRIRIGFRCGLCLSAFADAELAGLRGLLWQLSLDRVAYRHPAALGARNSAFDQNETAIDVGLHDLEIQRGNTRDAEMARHLLVLEGLAGILTAAGAADGTVRDRNAVRRPQPAEIPSLHTTGEALADSDAADIDELAGHKMIGGDFGADRNQ